MLPHIPSTVMLEEHRRTIERYQRDPSRPTAAVTGRSRLRHHLGGLLRAIADRLDPHGSYPRRVQVFVMPEPGCRPDAGEKAWR